MNIWRWLWLGSLLGGLACQPVPPDPGFRVEVVGTEAEGFGYSIWQGEKCLIRQPYLPALPGRVRCPDPACAERVGQLTVARLESGAFPPTLSQAEVQAALSP